MKSRTILACLLLAGVPTTATQTYAQPSNGPEVLIVHSLETQSSAYEGPTPEFRKLLRDIYETETGFSENIEVGNPARSTQPTG